MTAKTRVWVSREQNKRDKLSDDIKEIDEHDTPYMILDRIDEMNVEDEKFSFTLWDDDRGVTLSTDILFTGSEKHRRMVRKLVKATGLHRKYKADDRGRISLGAQYADKMVTVAIIEAGNDE